jgi:alkylhydroperoxidase family enzyme
VFSPLEKLVLDYAVVITKTPAEVPDELFTKLRQHFNEAQLVELTATIAWENYRARFNRAFGIESQNFSEKPYCPMPEYAIKD